jgi:hypothetical protein
MQDGEWESWVDKHAAMFALDGDHNAAMFAAWRQVFEARGYTAAELNEATVWIGGNAPPRYRSEHLDLLRRRIEARRLAASQAQVEMQNARGYSADCPRCNGARVLVVPHLGFVRDGRWVCPWPTFAVACGCVPGRRLWESLQTHETSKGVPSPLLSIGDYEMSNPAWADQLDERETARQRDNAAYDVTRNVDKRLGEILKGIGRKV